MIASLSKQRYGLHPGDAKFSDLYRKINRLPCARRKGNICSKKCMCTTQANTPRKTDASDSQAHVTSTRRRHKHENVDHGMCNLGFDTHDRNVQ